MTADRPTCAVCGRPVRWEGTLADGAWVHDRPTLRLAGPSHPVRLAGGQVVAAPTAPCGRTDLGHDQPCTLPAGHLDRWHYACDPETGDVLDSWRTEGVK